MSTLRRKFCAVYDFFRRRFTFSLVCAIIYSMKKKSALFLSFLKIGAFTFGGGYAMISLIHSEFVEKKGWMSKTEFLDMIAIAESTPGPIAINSATYLGYRVAGIWGAVLATLAVCLPSFVIIYLISLFFNAFLSLTVVEYAFRGIQVCVAYLILSAGFKMMKGLKKTPLALLLTTLTVAVMLLFTLLSVDFSSIFYILIGGAAGVAAYLVHSLKTRKDPDRKAKKDASEMPALFQKTTSKTGKNPGTGVKK